MANASKYIRPKWNLHNINDNIEWDLFEDYIVEYNDISGIEVDYYIRDESVSQDRLYGEATNIRYLTAKRTKVFNETWEELQVTTGWGQYSEDLIQYASMPKFTFSRDVSGSYTPKIGDVIKFVWNSRSFEVVMIHEEEKLFQLGKLVYSFMLKPYRYSEQGDSAKAISNDMDQTLTSPITAYGDNDYIEEQSDEIYDYTDVDSTVYGF
jgi:hypothetical protein